MIARPRKTKKKMRRALRRKGKVFDGFGRRLQGRTEHSVIMDAITGHRGIA